METKHGILFDKTHKYIYTEIMLSLLSYSGGYQLSSEYHGKCEHFFTNTTFEINENFFTNATFDINKDIFNIYKINDTHI